MVYHWQCYIKIRVLFFLSHVSSLKLEDGKQSGKLIRPGSGRARLWILAGLTPEALLCFSCVPKEYTIMISSLSQYCSFQECTGPRLFLQTTLNAASVHFDWLLKWTFKIILRTFKIIYIHKTGFWVSVSDENSDCALNDLSHCVGDKAVLRIYICAYGMTVNGL